MASRVDPLFDAHMELNRRADEYVAMAKDMVAEAVSCFRFQVFRRRRLMKRSAILLQCAKIYREQGVCLMEEFLGMPIPEGVSRITDNAVESPSSIGQIVQHELDIRGWSCKDAVMVLSGNYRENVLWMELIACHDIWMIHDAVFTDDDAKHLERIFGIKAAIWRWSNECFQMWKRNREKADEQKT